MRFEPLQLREFDSWKLDTPPRFNHPNGEPDPEQDEDDDEFDGDLGGEG